LFPPDDERLSLETCRGGKINTLKKEKSASSWLKIHNRTCTCNTQIVPEILLKFYTACFDENVVGKFQFPGILNRIET
jgi:hypothetical protein